ncbi:hypothetical protein [Niallia circulans]|uniref:hypothetical protein n=1 Tax=Niallia circulans TaxID=1397 RepID=UPI0035251704
MDKRKKKIKLETAINKFKDTNGNQVRIPLISKVQVLDNELYVEVEDYLDAPKEWDTDNLL